MSDSFSIGKFGWPDLLGAHANFQCGACHLDQIHISPQRVVSHFLLFGVEERLLLNVISKVFLMV